MIKVCGLAFIWVAEAIQMTAHKYLASEAPAWVLTPVNAPGDGVARRAINVCNMVFYFKFMSVNSYLLACLRPRHLHGAQQMSMQSRISRHCMSGAMYASIRCVMSFIFKVFMAESMLGTILGLSIVSVMLDGKELFVMHVCGLAFLFLGH